MTGSRCWVLDSRFRGNDDVLTTRKGNHEGCPYDGLASRDGYGFSETDLLAGLEVLVG